MERPCVCEKKIHAEARAEGVVVCARCAGHLRVAGAVGHAVTDGAREIGLFGGDRERAASFCDIAAARLP